MTTASWNTPITHTTDAQFRAWGSEMAAKLAAIGLVQTADTGQINWVTVVRPAVGVMGGYEIWRFNDTLAGTAPIYMKVEYGTGAAVTRPDAYITVGTGSNGSGTITGQATARTRFGVDQTAINTVTNYQSYACAVDGFAGMLNKFNGPLAGGSYFAFAVCRTCDATGAPTATGFVLYDRPGATSLIGPASVQAVRTASPAQTFTANSTGQFSFIVHGQASSVDGANTQAYLHWMPTPKVLPVFALCTMIATEAAFGTSFATTLVGTTPRTYISLSTGMGQGGAEATSNNQAICMLYE